MPRPPPGSPLIEEALLRAERRACLSETAQRRWDAIRDGAEPAELFWTLEFVERVEESRNLWCPRYDRCLDYAAALGWMSFSCEMCPHRRDGKPPPVEEVELSEDLDC